jgi:hypothetical protein
MSQDIPDARTHGLWVRAFVICGWAGRLVVAGGIEGELAEQLAGDRVDDADMQVLQVVDHRTADVTYPVTADRWWSTPYKIAKCAAAVVYVALTTVFIVGKAIKIVKAINAARAWVRSVSGATQAARLLIGAATPAERSRVLAQARSIVGASVLDFFGITQIREACF